MAKIKERIGIEIGIGIGDKVGIEFSKDDINSPETQIWPDISYMGNIL